MERNNIKSLNELMGHKYPEQEYIVDKLIPDGSITILSGQSRSFKTYTLLEIALCVASGKPLLDNFSTQRTGVLMIDEENGERLLQKRLKQLDVNEELPIHISSFSGFRLEDEHINQVLEFCKNNGIKLVIIDALIRVHGSDENSAREMSRVFEKLRIFTKHGVAILVTQHHRKAGPTNMGAGNEMRGSSDILAAVDSHIAVSRRSTFYLTFAQEKQRYDIELDPFQVKVHIDKDNFRFEYLGLFSKPLNKEAVLFPKVQELLAEHKQLMQGELLKKLSENNVTTNEHELRKLLKQWIAEGVLPKPNKGQGNTQLYWMEDSDNE
jgi:RecA-family ATPase